jgi:acetylornithine deacetylase
MHVDTDHLTATLADLVRINSVNPAFSDGSTNEREAAVYVSRALEQLGMEVTTHEPEVGRTSVVGRLPGRGAGRSLMLYGHLDTVGVGGMADPFGAEVRDGRLHGRGAYDMKGGLAACIAAAKALRDSDRELAGDLLVVAPADEEVASIGMQEVLEHHRADAAVVTEPTELGVCLAHKGFSWIEVVTTGRAAHGSRFEEGIDANMRMGRFLARLDELEQELRARPPHPLVGPPSLHAGVLEGGSGPSIYAARCRLEIERRTIPGETQRQVVGEIQDVVDRIAAGDETFAAEVRPTLTREPFEVAPEAEIVRAVSEEAEAVLGRSASHIGETYWMDAALIAAAGIETVVLGPVGTGAHADEEWVDLRSVAQLSDILARTAVAYCG